MQATAAYTYSSEQYGRPALTSSAQLAGLGLRLERYQFLMRGTLPCSASQ